jgi:hypothetical protein
MSKLAVHMRMCATRSRIAYDGAGLFDSSSLIFFISEIHSKLGYRPNLQFRHFEFEPSIDFAIA